MLTQLYFFSIFEFLHFFKDLCFNFGDNIVQLSLLFVRMGSLLFPLEFHQVLIVFNYYSDFRVN